MKTIYDIQRRNEETGHYFFSKGAKKFFRSKINPTVYGEKYFITSEQFVDSRGNKYSRLFTVRRINWETGDIGKVWSFQEFASLKEAKKALLSFIANGEKEDERE